MYARKCLNESRDKLHGSGKNKKVQKENGKKMERKATPACSQKTREKVQRKALAGMTLCVLVLYTTTFYDSPVKARSPRTFQQQGFFAPAIPSRVRESLARYI